MATKGRRTPGRRRREEEENCIAFADWCNWNAHMLPALRQVIHIPNGGERPSVVDANGNRYSPEGDRLRRMGVRAGAWDYLVAVVSSADGMLRPGLWIEFKSATGKLSDEQKEFGERQERFGYALAVVRSWEEAVIRVLEYIGAPHYSGRPQ